MSMDPRLPAPAYGHGRKRAESRPGRSEYIITHRHGSEYQKQSVFARAQPQALPSAYNNHGPFITPHHSATPPRRLVAHTASSPQRRHGRRRQQSIESARATSIVRSIRTDPRDREEDDAGLSIPSSSKLSSSEISDIDQRSPRSLKFAISLARSDSDKSSSVPLTRTSKIDLGHDGVKELRNIREDHYKVYKEKIFNVLSSRYTKSLDLGTPDEAELVVQPPPGPNQKSRNPLLTWIHLEGQKHTLQSLMTYVKSMNGLSDEEKYKARKLLESVIQYEKSLQTSQGVQISYVEAVCSHIKPEMGNKDEAQVVFLCLPYFELASLSKKSPFHSRGTHPPRTLLQYSHGRVTKSRDLQQAICHLDQSPKGHCFHISYLWCLVIGSDTLITCSNLSPPEIQQNRITTTELQSTQEPQIRVSDNIGRMWLLPIKDCTTWMEFTAHLRSLSTDFNKDYEVVFQGAVQDPANWHLIIERAPKETLNLTLQNKKTPRGNKSSRRRGSASSEDSDDDKPDSSMPAADEIFSANATNIKPKATAGISVHQVVDNESKGLDTERQAPIRTDFPESDSDRIQTASLNESYIFFRAVSIPDKADIPGEGSVKAEKVAHPARAPQSAAADDTFRYDTHRLNRIFADMDNHLRSKTFKRSRVYNKCPSRTLQEVEMRSMQILRAGEMASNKRTKVRSNTVESTSSTSPNPVVPDKEVIETNQAHIQTKSPRSPVIEVLRGGNDGTKPPETEKKSEEFPVASTKMDLERQKRFLKLAKALFKYILPLEFNLDLVAKYWGAVYVLVEDPLMLFKASKVFHSGGHWETDIIEALVIFTSDLTQGTAPPPWTIDIPDIFGEAWLHLVMGLVLSVDWRYAKNNEASQEFAAFRLAVIKGRKEILQNLAPHPLEEKQAVLSLGIISIVISNLVDNGIPGQPDTESTYLEYLDRLEHEVERNPYNRIHQEKLLYFRDEVSCIQKVLHDQLERMRDMQITYRDLVSLRGSPNDQAILHNSIVSTIDRISRFDEMNTRAINAGTYTIRRIDANKDRQEAAILLFTVVTIIFLPLSFMSSLFGMNTYDIRNMDKNQWIFWATAIPVTFIVVGLSAIAVLRIDSVRELWIRSVERDRHRRVVQYEDDEDD